MPKKVFAQKKVTVKYTLAWLPEGANIWSYAAKPFWTKAGIDVVIEKGTGSAAATQAIAQGKYEFGIPAAPNSIQQAVKGLPPAVARLLQLRHHHGRGGAAGIGRSRRRPISRARRSARP